MAVINTNIGALRAANASNSADKMLGTAMERLSTGKRINSAKDDAAGMAIATSMTAEVRGMSQGIRNANDGIALAQTAEGALSEVSNMMQRVRELAVQSKSRAPIGRDRPHLHAGGSRSADRADRRGPDQHQVQRQDAVQQGAARTSRRRCDRRRTADTVDTDQQRRSTAPSIGAPALDVIDCANAANDDRQIDRHGSMRSTPRALAGCRAEPLESVVNNLTTKSPTCRTPVAGSRTPTIRPKPRRCRRPRSSARPRPR